ncbi:MAG: hypothetical protein L0332_13630 [Chloroflexi bacterium]|nr:hypothetical protein [Chloroflexota bacterium]MCI0581133.1 hypothetical protein [Chloroflexota bacterium]MCI0649983.1 hypothetical protein [Chloroflexota bacterium]MCI0727745.1 hypothetical protein [Chloroflexota bacterium]
MKTTLSITDPLAGREVTIVITLAAGEQPREERPILVSAGVAGQLPVIKTGMFGEIATLINEAWLAFGLHQQFQAARAESETKPDGGESEVIAEAAVVEATAQPQPARPTPRPQALSLF